MLVTGRKAGESLVITDGVFCLVVTRGHAGRIELTVPKEFRIRRISYPPHESLVMTDGDTVIVAQRLPGGRIGIQAPKRFQIKRLESLPPQDRTAVERLTTCVA